MLAFTSSGGITDRYVWGPAVDQILEDEHYTTPSTSSAGTRYFTTFDKENSVRDLISSGDGLSGHVAYNSFGQITSSTIGYAMPFLHEGVYTDSATGMEYHSDPATGFPGRWYDPASRRWISEDPTGLAPDSNPYRYVGNGPTNFIDPTGLAELGKKTVTKVDIKNVHVKIWFSDAQDKDAKPSICFPDDESVTDKLKDKLKDKGKDFLKDILKNLDFEHVTEIIKASVPTAQLLKLLIFRIAIVADVDASLSDGSSITTSVNLIDKTWTNYPSLTEPALAQQEINNVIQQARTNSTQINLIKLVTKSLQSGN